MDCDCVAPYYGPPLTNICGGASYVVFMALLDTIIRKTCDVSDICGRVIASEQPREAYDFIVIGGGSGGATAAGKLAEVEGWRVLLIEAGIDEPPGTQVPAMMDVFEGNENADWNYKTEPEPVACQGYPDKRCSWPRAKILGGCSVINGMMYTRGTPADYNSWAAAGNEGWSYEDVLPVFRRSQDNLQIGELVDSKYHGKGGHFTVRRFNYQPEMAWDMLAAAEEVGFPVSDDINGENYVGIAIAQAANRNGARLSSARAFLNRHRNNPNLDVMLNSTVTKILFGNSPDGILEAQGVQFIYNNVTYTVKAEKEIILSAGTINSPQILLLSGVGAKADLDAVGIDQVHELPGVGKNLMNHVAFSVPFTLNNLANINDLDWDAVNEYEKNRGGPLSATAMSQVTGRLNSQYSNSSGTDPDIQLFFYGFNAMCSTTGEVGGIDNPKTNKTLSISAVNLHPKSRGSITLRSSNPLEAPVIVANYLTAPEDADILVNGIRYAQRLMNSTYLIEKYGVALVAKDYGNCSSTHEFDTDAFWQCAVRYSTGPENHQAGSCKMGPSSDELAVVDDHLRVHGIDRLRIMDASIMPRVVSGNTHATIVMIADKGVEFIRNLWLMN